MIFIIAASTKFIKADPYLRYSGAVVNTLMQPYLGKGHTLYINNWYNSPLLVYYVHNMKTNLCSTVNWKWYEMPKFGNLPKGGIAS